MTTRHGRKPSACHDKPTGSPRRTTPRGAFFRPPAARLAAKGTARRGFPRRGRPRIAAQHAAFRSSKGDIPQRERPQPAKRPTGGRRPWPFHQIQRTPPPRRQAANRNRRGRPMCLPKQTRMGQHEGRTHGAATTADARISRTDTKHDTALTKTNETITKRKKSCINIS